MYRPRFPPPCGQRASYYNNHGPPRFNGPLTPRFDGPPRMNGPPRHQVQRGPGIMPLLSPNNSGGPPNNFHDSHSPNPQYNRRFNVWGRDNSSPDSNGRAPDFDRGHHVQLHNNHNHNNQRQRGPPDPGPGSWQGQCGQWGGPGGPGPGPRGMAPPPRQLVQYGDISSDTSPFPSRGGRGSPFPGHRGGRGAMGNRKRGNKNQADNGPKAKKQCVNKRELPENNLFYCETCDRGFKTEEKYKGHVDEHEQCSVEGCSYKAAPKLVALHYRWQHTTGLAKKIWKVESKEDIEKWRNERKQKYPTVANVAKKEATQKDREKRGEVLETKTFGKMKNRRRGRGGRGDQGSTRPVYDGGAPQVPDPKEQKTSDQIMESKDIKEEGDPLSLLLSNQPGNSDDDDDKGGQGNAADTSGPVLAAGGLGNLVASYGDLSDSDNEGNAKKPTVCDNPTSTEQVKGTENVPPEVQEETQTRRSRKSRGKGRSKTSRAQMANPKRKSSLLEKLLAPEIRHERNVILQCVRHIVKNNFLGVGLKPVPGIKISQIMAVK